MCTAEFSGLHCGKYLCLAASLSSRAGHPPGSPLITVAVLGRRRPSVSAAQHQKEADGLPQVEVTPARQSPVSRRVRQIRDGHRREIHEILTLRLHHLHHGDDQRRLSGTRANARTRTMKHTLPAPAFKIKALTLGTDLENDTAAPHSGHFKEKYNIKLFPAASVKTNKHVRHDLNKFKLKKKLF